VTDVVLLQYYRAVASILRVPQEELSWYSVLNIFDKVTSAVACRQYDSFENKNLLILNQDCTCWSYLKMYQGSVFLDSLDTVCIA